VGALCFGGEPWPVQQGLQQAGQTDAVTAQRLKAAVIERNHGAK